MKFINETELLSEGRQPLQRLRPDGGESGVPRLPGSVWRTPWTGTHRAFDLKSARAETPGCQSVLHFNNAGAALMPQPVVKVMVDHLHAEAAIGSYEAAMHAQEDLELVYDHAAALLGCSRDEVAVLENATRAWTLVIQSIPLGPGDRILTGISEYVSNCLVLDMICARTGARMEVVPNGEDDRFSIDALRAAIDERVKLIALTHIPIYGGAVNPAAEVGRIARSAGILYVLDACQSVGQLPIDVRTLACDFLIVAGRKYLRGPRGTALLYVRSPVINELIVPSLDVHGTSWLPDGRYAVRDDARRFESWETNCAAKIGLGVAIDYAIQWRVESTWARIRSLGERLRMRLSDLPGIQLHDPSPEACGIMSFAVSTVESKKLQRALSERGVNVSISEAALTPLHPSARRLGSVIRASVHYYNNEDEIDAFAKALRSIVK